MKNNVEKKQQQNKTKSISSIFRHQRLWGRTNVDNNLNIRENVRRREKRFARRTVIVNFAFVFGVSASVDTSFAIRTGITSFVKGLKQNSAENFHLQRFESIYFSNRFDFLS